MRHGKLRDFCRYLSGCDGFDDRLGVVVFDDLRRAYPCLCLLARRLGGILEMYDGDDDRFSGVLLRRPYGAFTVVLLACPPQGKLRALLSNLSRTGDAVSPAGSHEGGARLVLAAPKALYFALPRSDPMRRIGCCLQLEAEIFEMGGTVH